MIRVICTDISELSPSDAQKLYERASEERKGRADRYRCRMDALRCVTADALLRYVVGTSDYAVEKTAFGKPFIKGKENFHYNLSHSGSWVVIAFGDSEVGVDVEELRADTDIEAIARQFFTTEERHYILKEEQNQHQRFFEIWTGKESYLKYLGTGLKKDMTSFSVLSPEPKVRLHYRTLPNGSLLSLCTTENAYLFEMLDVQRLL